MVTGQSVVNGSEATTTTTTTTTVEMIMDDKAHKLTAQSAPPFVGCGTADFLALLCLASSRAGPSTQQVINIRIREGQTLFLRLGVAISERDDDDDDRNELEAHRYIVRYRIRFGDTINAGLVVLAYGLGDINAPAG